MATLPAPPCSSSSPSSLFLTPNSCCWKVAPRATVHASAAAARRMLSFGWDLSGLSAGRPAARNARLKEFDTTSMLLRQHIVFLGFPILKEEKILQDYVLGLRLHSSIPIEFSSGLLNI